MILRLGIYFICQPLGNLRKDFSEDRPQGFGTNYLQRTFYSEIIQFQLGVVQHTRHSWQKIIFVKIWCKIRIYISCMPLNWTLDEWHGWWSLIGQLGQSWPLIGRSWCLGHCYDCRLQFKLTYVNLKVPQILCLSVFEINWKTANTNNLLEISSVWVADNVFIWNPLRS